MVADPTIRFSFEIRSSKASAPWTTTKMKSMIFGQAAAIKSAHDFAISESSFMDVTIFLKLAPAAIGIAGLLTYFMMSAREAVPDLELAKIVQRVRNIFLLLGCVALIMLSVWLIQRPAPPDQDTSLGPRRWRIAHARLNAARDLLQCRARRPCRRFWMRYWVKFGEMHFTSYARLASS